MWAGKLSGEWLAVSSVRRVSKCSRDIQGLLRLHRWRRFELYVVFLQDGPIGSIFFRGDDLGLILIADCGFGISVLWWCSLVGH